MILLIVVTLLVALLFSWWSIVLCPEKDQTTGFWCVCFTFCLQIIMGIAYRDVWEKEPAFIVVTVSFLQGHNFMSVRFASAFLDAYPSFRKLKPIIPAALCSGGTTLFMWSGVVSIVNKTPV